MTKNGDSTTGSQRCGAVYRGPLAEGRPRPTPCVRTRGDGHRYHEDASRPEALFWEASPDDELQADFLGLVPADRTEH